MKKISVLVSGTGEDELTDLEIESGTTAEDVLATLGLGTYKLLPEEDAPPFGSTENIYGQVEEGEKLYAIPEADVGR